MDSGRVVLAKMEDKPIHLPGYVSNDWDKFPRTIFVSNLRLFRELPKLPWGSFGLGENICKGVKQKKTKKFKQE